MENYLLMGALVSAMTGAVTDVRTNRIPNWLTYGSLLAALAIRGYLEAWYGLGAGVIGALVGGGAFFLLFVLGGMGAGDVKLMAAVGAWTGARQVLVVMIGSAIAGGVLALFYIVFYRRIGSTVRSMGELIRFHLTTGIGAHPDLNLQSSGVIRVPYGLAIAAGTSYVFWASTNLWRG